MASLQDTTEGLLKSFVRGVVKMSKVFDCKYPGAVAFGKHYPSPGRDVTNAKNGSAPGYVSKEGS